MMHSRILASRMRTNAALVGTPMRFFRKTMNADFYNQRFTPSQGKDNQYVHSAQHVHGANGAPSHKTERDPTKFEYSNNLFKNDYWEMRQRAGDYLYQISERLHRSNDGWTRTMVAYSAFSCYMMSYALIWKIHFGVTSMLCLARIRDKGAEPTLDEIHLLDTLFANDKIRELFKPTSYHVIDYDQEFDAGLDNPLFPEYRSSMARYFNADMNTTTGRYKIGDVDSGATMTLHFKTMPYSNNKYMFTEPFLIYDMWAEISHNGKVTTEQIVNHKDVLKSKRIFVLWH